MNANLGKFDISETRKGCWVVSRNGEPMNAEFGDREQAINFLRTHLYQRIDDMLLGI